MQFISQDSFNININIINSKLPVTKEPIRSSKDYCFHMFVFERCCAGMDKFLQQVFYAFHL